MVTEKKSGFFSYKTVPVHSIGGWVSMQCCVGNRFGVGGVILKYESADRISQM
jgi:hypothetical protein